MILFISSVRQIRTDVVEVGSAAEATLAREDPEVATADLPTTTTTRGMTIGEEEDTATANRATAATDQKRTLTATTVTEVLSVTAPIAVVAISSAKEAIETDPTIRATTVVGATRTAMEEATKATTRALTAAAGQIAVLPAAIGPTIRRGEDPTVADSLLEVPLLVEDLREELAEASNATRRRPIQGTRRLKGEACGRKEVYQYEKVLLCFHRFLTEETYSMSI